jgi:hypothetical protein
MWSLSQIRNRLGQRLAEHSPVFWSPEERNSYINEAQRFVAALTKGVPHTVTGEVSEAVPYLSVSAKLLGDYPSGGRVGHRAINFVPVAVAQMLYPSWRGAVGAPRWAIVAPEESRVYICPAPATPTTATVTVSILPPDLVGDNDRLFANARVMEKYQGVVLNVAAALALLKERYDGDAERFYSFAIQELQSLGIKPAEIPPLQQVAQNVDS